MFARPHKPSLELDAATTSCWTTGVNAGPKLWSPNGSTKRGRSSLWRRCGGFDRTGYCVFEWDNISLNHGLVGEGESRQTTETMSAAPRSPADNLSERFEHAVRRHVRPKTQAPLRIRGRFMFESAPAQVFAHLNDPDLISGWCGMIRSGSADHSQSCNAGTWEMGELNESVHHYDAPVASVYSVHSAASPIENHAGLLLLEPTLSGCVLEWSPFFDFRGLALEHMFPMLMVGMMNRGLGELQKQLGGQGGAMAVVR